MRMRRFTHINSQHSVTADGILAEVETEVEAEAEAETVTVPDVLVGISLLCFPKGLIEHYCQSIQRRHTD